MENLIFWIWFSFGSIVILLKRRRTRSTTASKLDYEQIDAAALKALRSPQTAHEVFKAQLEAEDALRALEAIERQIYHAKEERAQLAAEMGYTWNPDSKADKERRDVALQRREARLIAEADKYIIKLDKLGADGKDILEDIEGREG